MYLESESPSIALGELGKRGGMEKEGRTMKITMTEFEIKYKVEE